VSYLPAPAAGHNIGLQHSSTRDPTGLIADYQDTSDYMGFAITGAATTSDFSAGYKHVSGSCWRCSMR
jgi:hypothetical protein